MTAFLCSVCDSPTVIATAGIEYPGNLEGSYWELTCGRGHVLEPQPGLVLEFPAHPPAPVVEETDPLPSSGEVALSLVTYRVAKLWRGMRATNRPVLTCAPALATMLDRLVERADQAGV